MIISAALLAVVIAQAAPLAPAADLDTLVLVMSTSDRAVVRLGGTSATAATLITLERGDRVGRTGATVRDIAPGRLVLDEVTRDQDGRPKRAQIVLREGGPGGGRRYMRDPGLDAPIGLRPDVLGPDGKPAVARPGKRR